MWWAPLGLSGAHLVRIPNMIFIVQPDKLAIDPSHTVHLQGHMEKQEMEMKRKLEMETGNGNRKLKTEMEMQLLPYCSPQLLLSQCSLCLQFLLC